MLSRINSRALAIAVAVTLLAATFFVLQEGPETSSVSAYFDRTVSVYKGSEVRVMGVRIGTVTAVVPEGDRVRVAMEYDEEYKLPADAKAAIVTPTLTADRFVQIAPAYTGGEVLADGARIELPDTGAPVELDRIYQSLSDLSRSLGPSGANRNGALDDLLSAGTDALRGNGRLGNRALLDMSAAVRTFGENKGPLFASVRNMSRLTETLAANDRFVQSFMGDLTSVSSQLNAERGNLRKALAALARAVAIVRTFVRDNKQLLERDVEQLTEVVGTLSRQKDSLNTVARLGALGLGNLALGFDNDTGTQGARVQFGPTLSGFGNVLCDMVQNSAVPDKDFTCELLRTLVKPAMDRLGNNPTDPGARPQLRLGGTRPVTSLDGLLDSLRKGNR